MTRPHFYLLVALFCALFWGLLIYAVFGLLTALLIGGFAFVVSWLTLATVAGMEDKE